MERYLLAVDGALSPEPAASRAAVVAAALWWLEGDRGCAEVAVVEERRLSVCALWRRTRAGWRVRATPGWL